jgi:hypothetical protein
VVAVASHTIPVVAAAIHTPAVDGVANHTIAAAAVTMAVANDTGVVVYMVSPIVDLMRNIGMWWFNPGDWYWISVNWAGADHGAVYLMPNPVNQGTDVEVTEYAKEWNNRGEFNYWINVRNTSGIGTNVTIDGQDFP